MLKGRIERIKGNKNIFCIIKKFFTTTGINDGNHMTHSSFIHKIGFIGLGQMGSRMVKNLINNYPVIAYDIDSSKQLSSHPSFTQVSRLEDFKEASAIITMLPTSEMVKQVYNDLSKISKPSTIWIDCSTVDPDTSEHVYNQAQEIKCEAIDAPVSGGVIAAENGTLSFLVGGNLTKESESILMTMGKKIFQCGIKVGSGQKAKICNNMLLGTLMVATSEALCLAERLGIPPFTMNEIINECSGRNWVSECYSPIPGFHSNVPSSNHYQGGFKVKLMSKDLQLALNEVRKQYLKNFELLQTVARQYQVLDWDPMIREADFSINYMMHKDKCIK